MTVTRQIRSLYRQFRKHSPFMLVGHNAEQALDAAKTLMTFRELEDQGLVRIKADAEEENYFDVYGKPDNDREFKRLCDMLDRDGCWYVITEYLSPESEEWEHADSIGMCAGYGDPTSPFENCYVIGMMKEAIEKLQAETLD